MKKLLLFAVTAIIAASAAEARIADPRRGPAHPRGWSEPPVDCPLIVRFSSYGAGIDRPTLVGVERLLNTDRGVRSVSRHPWGREGEVSLCARTRTMEDAFRLSRRIRTMIPARPRGPIQVNTLRRHRL